MARPTKLTPALAKQVCEQLATGKPKYAAAAHCGIPRSTLADWLKKGADASAREAEGYEPKLNDKLYMTFVDAWDLAWDQGESFLWDEAWRLAREGGKWGLPITLLERTRRADWSPHARLPEFGAGGPLNVTLAFEVAEKPDMNLAEQ